MENDSVVMEVGHADGKAWSWGMRTERHGAGTCGRKGMELGHADGKAWSWGMRTERHGAGACGRKGMELDPSVLC